MGRRYVLDEPKSRRPARKPPEGAALAHGYNYRVCWLRRGMRRRKIKHFFTFDAALGLYRALSHPEPWIFWNPVAVTDSRGNYVFDRDTGQCVQRPVSGDDVYTGKWGNGTMTVREYIEKKRAEYSPLLSITIERQPTGRWAPLEGDWQWDDSLTTNGGRSNRPVYLGEPWAPLTRMLYPAPWDNKAWANLTPVWFGGEVPEEPECPF